MTIKGEGNFNDRLPERHSIRLDGYDYSHEGTYYLTICSYDKKCLFGKIHDGEMILNGIGKVANECWLEIPKHYPHVNLYEYIIMPNHIHGIIGISVHNKYAKNNVGAKNLSPTTEGHSEILMNDYIHSNRAKDFSPLQDTLPIHGTSKTVGAIVRGFKIGVTKWLRNNCPDKYPQNKPVWQRNYFEHIIRNDKSYYGIVEYIENNPKNWFKDKLWT